MTDKRGRERRLEERFRTSGKAAVVLFDIASGESEVLHGEIMDVSRAGACLVLPKLLHFETYGVVRMRLGSKTVVQGFQVRSARYDSARGTLVGVKFWEDPPCAGLEEIVRRLKSASPADEAA
ncbi:MAG: PilZ domain-containing protein [Planctomycetota bacterium]